MADLRMLQPQEVQSLEVFEMRCLQAIRGVTRADRLQNIKLREDTFTNESTTDVIRHRRCGLGMFPTRKEITSFSKHTNKILKDSITEEVD